ncbi:MAG: hypothetical protein WAK83_12390 [Trebonia sp.]|jgi:hypothetical protein
MCLTRHQTTVDPDFADTLLLEPVYWAMIITMSRRLARSQQPAQPRAA